MFSKNPLPCWTFWGLLRPNFFKNRTLSSFTKAPVSTIGSIKKTIKNDGPTSQTFTKNKGHES